MPPRIHTDAPLLAGTSILLSANAARHVQVLRLQPGEQITLFNGLGGQWQAEVLTMGRHSVNVRLLAPNAVERELATPVTLALGMPANERMDTLVEKATELGATAIVPLLCERSVLRLAGERAQRRTAHWQAVAVAACEQSGRNRVPLVHPPQALRDWLGSAPAPARGLRLVLSLAGSTLSLAARLAGSAPHTPLTLLSGPEGGLSADELAAADAAGYLPTTLGARVLRADTAPLAALAAIAALETTA